MTENTYKEGHFLNAEEKALKHKIMSQLLSIMQNNIDNNMEIFKNDQTLMDMVGSILIMFNREVLVKIMKAYGISSDKDIIMDNLFTGIRKKVNEELDK